MNRAFNRLTWAVACTALALVGLARALSPAPLAYADPAGASGAILLNDAPAAPAPTPARAADNSAALDQQATLLFLPALISAPAAPPATPIASATPTEAPTSEPPTPTGEPLPGGWIERANSYRALAGVPPVTADAALNDNCFEHARYMAENNHLTHNQNPALPWASPAGQVCGENGNAFLGWGAWQPADAIDAWMGSIGHRLWLLYPTTPTFGFGIYSNGDRTGAGLDVLSRARLGDDEQFAGWPVRYPAAGQQGVPAGQQAVTLLWPYFDDAPVLSETRLHTLAGAPIAHTAMTDLPAGHKGVVLTPDGPLPPATTVEVAVAGSYKGQPFQLVWVFTTE